MSSPNETVSERIVAELEAKDILQRSSTTGLKEKLASGRLDALGWVKLFELDVKTRKQNAEDETQKH